MNRKEMACAAAGAILGAAGCSPAMKTLALPEAGAAETASIAAGTPVANTPHLEEAVITLISGTTRDASSALFHLLPKSDWSAASSDPRLQASVDRGHVVVLQAPEDEKVWFVAIVTISHPSGTEFLVRCHVEERCS